MNENESCKQLYRKLEALGSESDSQATKSILKLVQKLQNLIHGFVMPDNLELVKPDSVMPKGAKRKTSSSRRGKQSIAPPQRSKRRKLSDVQVDSNGDSVQVVLDSPLTATDVDMPAIAEEVCTPPAPPTLNATYTKTPCRPSKSDSRTFILQDAVRSTSFATATGSSRSNPRSTAETAVSGSQGHVSNAIQSPSRTKESSGFSRNESGSLRMSTEKDKTLEASENQVPQNIEVPHPVENCVQQPEETYRQAVNSDVMTEESEGDIEQPLSTAVITEGVSTAASDTSNPSEVVPTQSTTASKPVFVKPIFPVVASTPNFQQHSTAWSVSSSRWLSRLGWSAASKAPPTISEISQQPHTANVMGKIKNVLLTNTAPKGASTLSGLKMTKPAPNLSSIGRSTQRLATVSRPNNLAGPSKANCSAIAEKPFGGPVRRTSTAHGTATGGVRLGTGMSILTSKEQAENERRERLIAEMAEKEERQREALERKALEHKAKVKAANERRAAVRANAEALAKKQEAEKLKKLLALKDKPLPSKPPISATLQPVSHVVKQHQPLGTVPSNMVNVTSLVSSVATNHVKNFDLVKIPPPQSKASVHAVPEPISYDLTGILDEYDSDSDRDNRAKRRPIPSWARPDSQFLVEMVSKAYRGELRWQNIFRPAEEIQFDDADLFYGYEFRTRPRGSSAVWFSPSRSRSSHKSDSR